jgi:hypothetical protein
MKVWVKMWPLAIFFGSLRVQCDLTERGLWYEMIFLAKICRVAELFPPRKELGINREHVEKLISLNETTPHPRPYLAEFFGVDLNWLETTLTKFKEQKRIREDERGIWIINWEKYQSAYDRQEIYRKGHKSTVSKTKAGWTQAPDCTYCGTHVHMDKIKLDDGGTGAKCEKCGAVYEWKGGGRWEYKGGSRGIKEGKSKK